MMTKKTAGLLVLACCMILAGCAQRSVYVGGPCEYADVAGKAVITAVGAPDPDEANCADKPRVVLFDFTPDDKRARNRFPNWGETGQRLTVAGGKNPPLEWLKANGVRLGAELICIRREILKGTCTPVIYDFPALDMTAAAKACR
ncbi:MAG: hypothetical protein AB1921_12550 [Thermodesulfobacteriota bacterium]